jgi:bis(5'-nucleosidyl)-tetraphosphatase
MKHPNRYDLPKGHREVGENDHETALRELREETGIVADDLNIIKDFTFEETYYPKYKRFGGEKVEKKLVIFMASLKDEKEIKLSEHKGFEVFDY